MSRQCSMRIFPNTIIPRLILFLIVGILSCASVQAQEYVTDTLRLSVFFRRNVSNVDPLYRDNGKNLCSFKEQLDNYLRDSSAIVRNIIIRTSASPEGATDHNLELSRRRAESIDRWITDSLGLSEELFRYQPIGEDWEGLANLVSALDTPWRDEVLDIIRNTPVWVTEGGKVVDSRKRRLMRLQGGQVWNYLDDNVFPELRSASGSVSCIITRRVVVSPSDTVYVDRTVTNLDTVFVASPDTVFVIEPESARPKRKSFDTDGKRMLFALRTNIVAIPFTNVGLEVPLGEHISVAADWYSPWIWRERHSENVDVQGWCFEFQALDLEARYWFTNHGKQPAQRLLGHSVGLYGATGHYDFGHRAAGDALEYSHGHQGKFFNVGVDYLYAFPIWGGRMHMELELGVGYIQSPAIPYDSYEPGGKAYYRPGITEMVRWFGPTRAQVSVVVPIYVKYGDKK